MKKLLITGFEPFGGAAVNPAWEAVKRLPERIGDYELMKLQIPTAFGEAAQLVLSWAESWKPDAVIAVGQAGGRSAVTPERIGINLRLATIPDNRGVQPAGEKVMLDGPDGLFSPLPVENMAEAIRKKGLPGQVSNTAGTFVCNDVLYSLLYRFKGTAVRAGFIHVPWLPEQGSPSLELEKTVQALTAAIEVI